MKLLSCYVENYGKIKKQDFAFDKNLTSYCESNGFGKTTLASFIKAMFYGLEPYRSNSRDFCERLHFCPFDGGKFGGNLTFEAGGKIYKIERFFGEKSDTQDECTVYLNGKKTTEFGTDIGRAIFGIDSKSFERTVFIGSDEIEISSTSSINAKLNNFIDGNDENFDNALKILEAKSKEYKKSRAGNDAISAKKKEIEELNYSITNAQAVQAALTAKYSRHSENRGKIASLEKQLEAAQTLNLVLKDWERYDGFCQDAENDGAKIKAIESRYPFGIPSLEEVEKVTAHLEREAELKAKLSQRTFDESDEAKLARLKDKFSKGVPDADELKDIERGIQTVNSLETEISLASGRQLTEKEQKLRRTFAAGVPDEKQVEAVRKKVDEYKEAEREYNLHPAAVQQTGAGKSSKLFLILAIVAALVIAAGIGVIFVHLIAGIVIAAAGAVCLLADGFLYLNKKLTKANVAVDSPERSRLALRITELSDGIKAFLLPYGYYSENGLAFDFATFEEDLKTFTALENAEKTGGEALKQKEAQKQETEQKIESFFEGFGYSGGYLANLTALRGDIAEYENLSDRKRKSAQNSDEIQSKISENGAAVTAFCKTYRIDCDDLKNRVKACGEDVRTLADLRENLAKTKRRAAQFKAEHNLVERPKGGAENFEELNAELNALRDETNRLYREICDDESQVEKLEGFYADKSAAEEELKEYNKKYELLAACMDCLKTAEQNLKDKYVKPVRDKFIDYSALLEKTLGEKITMNSNFEISFERSGKERSEKHFSAGQRTICAFCFRLALIWNMYEGEKPFLILDDPFVSLDGQHLEKVKVLLKDLSQKMQIIYFSCHDSRKV